MKKKFNVKKIVTILSVLCFAALAFTFISQAVVPGGKAKIDKELFADPGGKQAPEYAEGEVLVKLKKGIRSEAVSALADSVSAKVTKHYRAVSRVNGQIYVHLKSELMTTNEMIGKLQKKATVESVSPNYVVHIDATEPNDPRFTQLWGLHNTGQTGGTQGVDINAPEAWDSVTGSADVIVAVIDTGISYNHTDLAANIWANPGEVPGNGIDDDGNRYIDDVHGINAIVGSGDPMDDNGHGTHCAGTIGAVGNNSKEVAGINWNVKLLGAKFLTASGYGYTSDAIESIDYIVNMKTTYGQNIVAINASWGGGGYSQALKDAIDAAGTAGIVFCAAAGNYGGDNDLYPHYPSSYDSSSIIAVTAVDHDGSPYYNYGETSVDLAAPGVSILSTVPCEYVPKPGDIFFDDMESGSGNWVTGGANNTWAITPGQEGFNNPTFPVPSPPNFWSDSPGTDYAPYTDSWLMNAADIDLSGYTGQNVYLGFGSAMFIEGYYDNAIVEISGDSGGNWTPLMDFSGYGYYWKTGYTYLIPDCLKTANFRFRFHLITDSSVEYWGWLIDDVGIGNIVTCGSEFKNGTSMATPHVTGAVALLSARFPDVPMEKIVKTILDKTTPLASLSGLCSTGGLLNLNVGTITVTTPNGGETLMPYGCCAINWTSANVTGDVTISLKKDGVRVALLACNVCTASGAYTWNVGECLSGTVTPGTGYRILVREKNSIIRDVSDDTFTIAEPSLTVTSPNGGEVWTIGSTENITWSAIGLSPDDEMYIIIKKAGGNYSLIKKRVDPTAGTYSWTVGELAAGNVSAGTGYRIILKIDGKAINDRSDGTFQLVN